MLYNIAMKFLRIPCVAWLSRTCFQLPSRAILGGVLLAAGILKLPVIDTLAWEIGQYRILPSFLVSPFAAVLPFVEIGLGSLLLLGIYTRITGLFSGLLTVGFTIVKLKAYIQGLDIDICPCLGPLLPLLLGPGLALNGIMLLCAVVLAAGKNDVLSLSALVARRREGKHERPS